MLDLCVKLAETEAAIALLLGMGEDVPEEAHEIAEILRRAIAAESEIERLNGKINAAVSSNAKLVDELSGHRAWVPVAVEAMRTPIDEAREKGNWSATDPDESSWSPNAHIELTLSVAELRAFAAALASAPTE